LTDPSPDTHTEVGTGLAATPARVVVVGSGFADWTGWAPPEVLTPRIPSWVVKSG
jgi:hypothetical protein